MFPDDSEFEALVKKYIQQEAEEFRPRPRLSGFRMAWFSEPDEDTFLDTTALKALTGGDTLFAREMGFHPDFTFTDVFRQQIFQDAAVTADDCPDLEEIES